MNLKTEILGQLPLVFVTSPENPLVYQDSVRASDIKNETILLPKGDCSYRMLFEKRLTEENIKPAAILNFNSIEAIKHCLMAGIGITIIPEIAVREELAKGELAVLSWTGKSLDVYVFMICYKEKWLSPTLSAFMETAREIITS